MRVIAILVALALAGCKTVSTPEPVIRTVEVKVPVAVPCRPKLPPEPVYAADVAPLDQNIFEQAKTLLVDREQRKERAAIEKAAREGCSGVPK